MAQSNSPRSNRKALPPRQNGFTLVSITSLRHFNQMLAANVVLGLMNLIATLVAFNTLNK